MLEESLYKVIYNSTSISHQCCRGCPLNIAIQAKSACFDSIKCLLRRTDLAGVSLITHWKSSWILHWPIRWGRLNAWWDKLNIPIENDLHSVWCIMHSLLLIHVIGSLIWNSTEPGILRPSPPQFSLTEYFYYLYGNLHSSLVSYCKHC